MKIKEKLGGVPTTLQKLNFSLEEFQLPCKITRFLRDSSISDYGDK
jgi:hypothetical protein